MSFDLSDLSFSRSNPDQRGRTDRTMSAEAMLAVIDSLRVEKNHEVEKFQTAVSQHVSTPFHYEPTRIFELNEEALADTFSVYVTQYIAMDLLPNPNVQRSAINRAISAIDRYRPELESLRTNLNWRDLRIAEFTVEVHKKLSIPFACVVFVLLGAPIGMLTRKGNIGVAAIISAVLLTVYFIAIIQGEKFADRMIISPFMGMWGINIIYMTIGLILILHVSTSFRITNLFRRE